MSILPTISKKIKYLGVFHNYTAGNMCKLHNYEKKHLKNLQLYPKFITYSY